MRIVALVALCGVAANGQRVEQSSSGGQIRGLVVDTEGASISAFIRVIETDSGGAVARTRADLTGRFQTGFLGAGSYTVTAGAPGFRRRDLTRIAVRHGETTDVGRIKLALAGCDAPGVNCDYFFTSDLELRKWEAASAPETRGSLRMKVGHGEETGESVDLRFTKDGAHVYLVAVNGAAIAMPDSTATACGDSKYSETRIRADGLGPGVDLCVRHKGGAVSHLFFIEDVEPDSPEINLRYVTRR